MRYAPGVRACAWTESPVLGSLSDGGVQERTYLGDTGRIIDIDRALRGINHGVKQLVLARDTGSPSPGAIAPIDFPLLCELARDGLPVEVHVRMAPAHAPLLLGVNRRVINTHKVHVFPAHLDRAAAHPLLGHDNGRLWRVIVALIVTSLLIHE
jgi:hypothetical protein